MNWKWQQIVFSLIAEIILNFVGYDQLADYSEFISAQSSKICDRTSETLTEIATFSENSSLVFPDRPLI
jgi:hypothetical protein